MPKIYSSPKQRKGSFSSLLPSADSLAKWGDQQFLPHNINSSSAPWNNENKWGWWCNGQNKKHYMGLISFFVKIFWNHPISGRCPTLITEKWDPEKPFLPKHRNEMHWRGKKIKGDRNIGMKLSSSRGDAAEVPERFHHAEQPFFQIPLPTVQASAPHMPPPAPTDKELVHFSPQKMWTEIKHSAVSVRRSAGEGCWLQAEDAARLLSVEKEAHICLLCSRQRLSACTSFNPQHLLLHPQGLSDTVSIYPFTSLQWDIHEVRGRPGERSGEGRYTLLWAFLGLLPLCFWFWSLTGREIWPAWPHHLIFSMEGWSHGWWNIFISHQKKAKSLPSLHPWLHKDRLFLMCADLNDVLPLRKTISGCCLQGTWETAFG